MILLAGIELRYGIVVAILVLQQLLAVGLGIYHLVRQVLGGVGVGSQWVEHQDGCQ